MWRFPQSSVLHQRRWCDLVWSENHSTQVSSSQRFTRVKSPVANRSAAASAMGANIRAGVSCCLTRSIVSERGLFHTSRGWLCASARKPLRIDGSPRCPAFRFSTSERMLSRSIRAACTRDIGALCGRLFATGNPACLSQRNTSSSLCKKSTNSPFTRIRVFRKSSAG